MIYVYPKDLLPPRKVIPEIVPATVDSGRQNTAVEEFSPVDIGYWQIDLQDIPLASGAQKLAWRALSLNLNGRFGIANVPTYEAEISPWPIGGDGLPLYPWMSGFSDLTGFSDGTWFSDGTIEAEVTTLAPIGATQLHLQYLYDPPFLPQPMAEGMDFSIEGAVLTRLYRIKDVVHASTNGVSFTVNIEPPLRDAVGIGTPVNFEDPRCSCRLADDQQMFSGSDDYAGRTLASLSFVEVINP